MSEMTDEDREAIEEARWRILDEFCLSAPHSGGYHFGTPPEHHADLEQITEVALIDGLHAHVWTNYLPEGSYPRRRRYELQFQDGSWLIAQHYLLDDDLEDFAEL